MAVDADEMSFKRESWFFAAKKKRAKEWKVRSFDSEHFNSLAFPESRALSKQNSKDFCGGSIIHNKASIVVHLQDGDAGRKGRRAAAHDQDKDMSEVRE